MSLASSLAPREHKPETPQRSTDATKPEQPRMRTAHKTVPSPGTGAKYTDPDFMQLKVYVRRKTKTAAARKWEDSGGRELSELVETLLDKYLSS
jgi:hypothetical protein